MTIPVSEDEEVEGDDDGLPNDPDLRSTSILVREATASAGINKKRRQDDKGSDRRQKALRSAQGGRFLKGVFANY